MAIHKKSISPKVLKWLMNCWPPFIGAGITVQLISDDWKDARVKLRKGLFNRNYFGVHFGGSLYAMSDAMYVLQLANLLGERYIVWDTGATIDYVNPGKSHVYADFHVSDAQIEDIKLKTQSGEKYEPEFLVEISDDNGQLIARVHKKLYIKLKKRYRESAAE